MRHIYSCVLVWWPSSHSINSESPVDTLSSDQSRCSTSVPASLPGLQHRSPPTVSWPASPGCWGATCWSSGAGASTEQTITTNFIQLTATLPSCQHKIEFFNQQLLFYQFSSGKTFPSENIFHVNFCFKTSWLTTKHTRRGFKYILLSLHHHFIHSHWNDLVQSRAGHLLDMTSKEWFTSINLILTTTRPQQTLNWTC